jgi:hypothetical protein
LTLGGPRCSAEALARHEPLYATASLVSSWLLIEQPGAWGPDALTDSKFPDDVAATLQESSADVRILLIRQRSNSSTGPVFYKAHSGGQGVTPSLVVAPLFDPSELLEVDLAALAGGDTGPGTVVDHPIYLVCTHGRHDICCADRGRPLYRAMSEIRPERTWEVSHLGGDRFAGNLLVLPRGDYFGRLEPEDADPLVADYEAGKLDVTHHRGRSIQPRLVQAAEHFLRVAEGLSGLEDVEMTGYRRRSHDRAEVTFATPAGSIEMDVSAHEDSEEARLTCRAEQPGHVVSYKVDSVTRPGSE